MAPDCFKWRSETGTGPVVVTWSVVGTRKIDFSTYELLKPEETVNTQRYQQQLIKKRSNQTTQSHFSSWYCSITYDKIGSGYVGCTHDQLGSSVPCYLLTRLGSFRLPLVGSLGRWVTHLLSSASVRTNMWKSGSVNGLQQKGKIFTDAVFTKYPKYRKGVV